MDLKIKGKKGVVAAASSGLGRAVAESLAEEGVDLVICSRNREKIKKAAEEISVKYKANVFPVSCDVTIEGDLLKLKEEVEKKLGTCHILFANAGGPPPGGVEDFSTEDLNNALKLNLFSTVNLVKTFLPYMRRELWGRILASTSISVKQPIPSLALSNISRAGVVSYIKTLSDQVGKFNITANVIAPGYIQTGRVVQILNNKAKKEGKSYEEVKGELKKAIPVNKIGSPEEFGAFSAFLLSDLASYITGDTILIDGGMYRGTM
ncbi:MAG: SDR family oxidoreductase [Acidobacteriota bacterium]